MEYDSDDNTDGNSLPIISEMKQTKINSCETVLYVSLSKPVHLISLGFTIVTLISLLYIVPSAIAIIIVK
jgi:hypothetical protein